MVHYLYSAKGRQELPTRSRNSLALLYKRRPYTLKPLDEYLKTLRAVKVSDLQYSETKLRWAESHKIGAVLDALTGISIIAERCANPKTDISPSLKQTTTEEILASFDLIEGWASFFLTPKAPCPKITPTGGGVPNLVAYLLFTIAYLHPLALQRLCSSTTSIDLVIRIWTIENEDGQPYADIESETGCSIVPLMGHCTEKEQEQGAFIDRMGSREVTLPRRVALVTIQRLDAARFALMGREGRSRVSPESALRYLRSVLLVVNKLVTDPRMHKAFEFYSYAHKIASTLRDFLEVLKKSSLGRYAYELCGCVRVALGAILVLPVDNLPYNRGGNLAVDNFNRPHNLALALAHGLMGTIISLIKTCGTDVGGGTSDVDINARNLATCLEMLEINLPWKSVLLQLQPNFEGQSEFEAEKSIGRVPERLREAWKSFNIAVHEHLAVYDVWDGRVALCDNIQCQRDAKRTLEHGTLASGGWASLPKSKKCSGCSAFVYCGEDCQKQDWHARHSRECSRARVDTIACRATPGAYYSPRQRAYHVAFIEHHFNLFLALLCYYRGLTIKPDEVNPTFTEAVLKWLWGGLGAPRVFYLDRERPTSVQNKKGAFNGICEGGYPPQLLNGMTQGYRRPRIDEYLWASGVLGGEPGRDAKAEDMHKIQYVECKFGFGDMDLHVMVKMRLNMDERRGVGRFLAVSSMARFGLKS
ncbi:hypothetical protein DFP72DRAFT_1176344 [Ephemerocybe angulata]|uniref:MYND-type domain-containing protein n=1 Tax=Ephemerocybe angulata TaxID=980116 RepID=A0A8H6LVG9_9AGAR|nr:hypothetical protein DFP72DRAFT_1176344 [Tulosesus angulatus]